MIRISQLATAITAMVAINANALTLESYDSILEIRYKKLFETYSEAIGYLRGCPIIENSDRNNDLVISAKRELNYVVQGYKAVGLKEAEALIAVRTELDTKHFENEAEMMRLVDMSGCQLEARGKLYRALQHIGAFEGIMQMRRLSEN